jgi:hypothetical protein
MGNWQSPSGGREDVTVFYRFFVLAKPAVRTPAACGPREDKNMATSYRRVVVVDQVPQIGFSRLILRIRSRTSLSIGRTRLPSPVSGETHSMPTQDGLGPDDGYGVKDARAATIEPNEQSTIGPTLNALGVACAAAGH